MKNTQELLEIRKRELDLMKSRGLESEKVQIRLSSLQLDRLQHIIDQVPQEYPTKHVIPRPPIHWDFSAPAYHHEVMKRKNDALLKNWEKAVADEEINYVQRVRLWEKNESERGERCERFRKHKEMQYQAHIEKQARELIRKEKEQT